MECLKACLFMRINLKLLKPLLLTTLAAGLTLSAQAGPYYTLGMSNWVTGPAAGTNSVVLTMNPAYWDFWTGTNNAAWLHMPVTIGLGSANIVFTFDANSGGTRTGTLTIAGQTLTITQAGSNYVPVASVTTLVGSGLNNPDAIAVDAAGNVYIADADNFAIKEWNVASNSVTTLMSDLTWLTAVAVDGAGNVYSDNGNGIQKWYADSDVVTTLVPGFLDAGGLAVDGSGNVYIANTDTNAIDEWYASSHSMSTLVSGSYLPYEVALDGSGNVYFADMWNGIQEWNSGNSNVVNLVPMAYYPAATSVAVDGGGNVFFNANGIQEWNAASGNVSTVVSISVSSLSVSLAVDGACNVYIANSANNVISELPRAFVVPTALEGGAAGNDALPAVVPATANMTGPFVPTSNKSWLAITGVTNGVTSFSFTSNPAYSNRTATITLLGQPVAVTQLPLSSLGATNLFESAPAGTDSVALTALLSGVSWTATANTNWLHLATTNGIGSTNVVFTFDANSGDARSGTLTIAGWTVTVNQSAPVYTLGSTNLQEGPDAGTDHVQLTTDVATAPWTNSANAAWLHMVTTNGVGSTNVVFAFDANFGGARTGTLTIATQTVTVSQSAPFCSFAATNLVECPGAGTDSVVLVMHPATAAWTNTAGSPWLHLAVTNGIVGTNVVFSFDANTGPTRAGTLSFGGQTLPITQAGSNYVAANSVFTVTNKNLGMLVGLAVDGAGNIYIADAGNNAVKEWNLSSNTVTTLVSGVSGLNALAVDTTGNVYFAYENFVKEWNAVSNKVFQLNNGQGIGNIGGLAVDSAGNVYIADNHNNAIYLWSPTNNINSTPATLLSSNAVTPLYQPDGVALDAAGNVYILEHGDNDVKKWNAASSNLTILVSSNATTPLYYPRGVAVDGSGNVYIADTQDNAVKRWNATDGSLTTLVATNSPNAVAVDSSRNVYIASMGVLELTRAFVDTTAITETAVGGSDTLPVVLPATENLTGPFTPTNNTTWLTIAGATNGVVTFNFSTNYGALRVATISLLDQSLLVTQAGPLLILSQTNFQEEPPSGTNSLVLSVNVVPVPWTNTANVSWLHLLTAPVISSGCTTNVVFSFDANPGAARTGTLTVAGQTVTVTQAALACFLGATNLVEGPASGNDSVVLEVTDNSAAWTASANVSWLHLPASGAGSTNFIFAFERNTGAARSGTMTIAGLTLTVTQAGTNCVQACSIASLGWTQNSGSPALATSQVAVDAAGNLYDVFLYNLRMWNPTNGVSTLWTTNSGQTFGLVLDRFGNIYFDLAGNVFKWSAADGMVTPLGVRGYCNGVDALGNVYILSSIGGSCSDYSKWNAADGTVTTIPADLIGGTIAVDAAGNVYGFSPPFWMDQYDDFFYSLTKYSAVDGSATILTTNLMLGRLIVDGSGNVIDWADYPGGTNRGYFKWNAVNGEISSVGPVFTNDSINLGDYSYFEPREFFGLDGSGDIFVESVGRTNVCAAITKAYVDLTSRSEGAAAGTDTLPPLLPVPKNAAQIYPLSSDQPWLSVTGVTNGVVSFGFAANTGPVNRTAHITVLNQIVAITQYHAPVLGATNLLQGPGAGTASVVLSVSPATVTWTVSANAAWLHPVTTAGAGSTNVLFTLDANSGATRTGTLTIAGQTFTVTQAGSTYVAANPVATLASGWFYPAGLALDPAGDIFTSDLLNDTIDQWTASAGTMSTVVSQLNAPGGVAVDASTNLFIADTDDNLVATWTAASNLLTTVVGANLCEPAGVAVDLSDNVYIADTGNNAVKEWTMANGNIVTLVSSGLASPASVAVDLSGNVYIADTANNAVKEWNARSGGVTTLVASGLNQPGGLSVDGWGNVLIADSGNSAVKQWNAASNTVVTLISSGLSGPGGVVMDRAGNIFIADTWNSAIKEQPRAFVDPTARVESAAAGSDTLPVVLPASASLTASFAPSSDQSWLTITGVTNGAVSFSFAATATNRTAHITLLGQTIAVTQIGVLTSPKLSGTLLSASGAFQITFTNQPGGIFDVLSATNVALPLSQWTVVGSAAETASGQYQFIVSNTAASMQRFYRVRSP
jgi:sugar lactone lactonase YvrE